MSSKRRENGDLIMLNWCKLSKRKFYIKCRYDWKSFNNHLNKKSFLEIFGILGMESTSFLLEWMFIVMDKDKDG